MNKSLNWCICRYSDKQKQIYKVSCGRYFYPVVVLSLVIQNVNRQTKYSYNFPVNFGKYDAKSSYNKSYRDLTIREFLRDVKLCHCLKL